MSKEAMKLALEALEYIYEGANKQGPHTGISWRCVSNKAEPAITALREALNAPLAEQKSGIKQVIELYDSPEQPSGGATSSHQKPFGYIKPGEGDYEKVFSWNRNERTGYTQALYTTPQAQPAQQEPVECKTLCELCVKRSYHFCANSAQTTLIPSPPAQRTWVGLTDEEMIDLQDRCGISIHQSDFQTIEAKLKAKNFA